MLVFKHALPHCGRACFVKGKKKKCQLAEGKIQAGRLTIIRMKKWIIIAMVLVFGLLSFTRKPADKFVVPQGWPKPVYNFKKHPLDQQKVELGKRLFNETLLSRDNTISCNSCHAQYTAFAHTDHTLSHGIKGRIGPRNSPALMNLAWSESFMLDGSVTQLDLQAEKPITNPLEMDETIAHVVAKLQATRNYPPMFYRAFGDSLITGEMLMQSLSQFMLTLVSANAKYDRVKNGIDTFTTREARGYALFKQNCGACHTEPLFTNGQFENNGLAVDDALADGGRIKVTHRAVDSLKFKVPTLRNIEVSYPYMHDGRFRNLQMVLFQYAEHVVQSNTLSDKLRKKLVFTEQDKGDIIQFLKTLTDEEFLKNKKFEFVTN